MEVPPSHDFVTIETSEKEKQTCNVGTPGKLTILRIKRKRNEEFLDTIVLEERPTKISKKKIEETISAFASLKFSDVDPFSTLHNTGRKLFRYIGSGDFEPNIEEVVSKKRELVKAKGTPTKENLLLDREKRSIKQTHVSKSARFNKVNKLRTFTPSLELKNKTGYSLLELVTSEEEKVAPTSKVKKSMILLDVPPKIKSSLSPSEPTEPDIVTDYYYLEDNFEAYDEVADTPTVVIPVESFDVESDSIFVDEYDVDIFDNNDSEPEDNDYPSTPDEDSMEKYWGDNADSSEDENAENSSSDEGYGYNQGDSNEEYDDYE